MISESWLRDGENLQHDLVDLEEGQGLKMIMNNRKSRRGKVIGGGVAIVYNGSKIKLTERRFRRGKAELVDAAGKIAGLSRKIVIFTAYTPPRTRVPHANEALEFLNRAIAEAKEEYEDPIIIVGGDFNGRDVDAAVGEFPDLKR